MNVAPTAELSSVFPNPPNSKRVYQVWKGSNRFFLGGRLVFGPDARSLLLTLFLIIAPVVIFIVFVGRHLMKEFPHHTGIAIVVVVVVHTSVVLVLLLLTSGRDPGIIPRSPHPPEPEDDAGSSSEWSSSQTPKLRLPRTRDVIVNGVVVKVKYCDTCMLYRPPRCSHCSICNNCVERFDHHCPWVGQCIGKRNYPYFFAFVLSTTLLCFYIFAMCALRIKMLMNGDPPLTVWKALQRSPASAFLMAYAFLATWFVGGLTIFHLYLMSTNQTTYENFRYRYDNKVNPYNRGIWQNLKEILCSGIPPSKVDFRAEAPPETMVFGNYSTQQRSRDNLEMISSTTSGKKAVGDFQPGGQSVWGSHTGAMKSTQIINALDQDTGVASEEIMHSLDGGLPQDHELESTKNGGPTAHPRRSSWGQHLMNWDISVGALDLSSSTAGGGVPSDQGISSPGARKEN